MLDSERAYFVLLKDGSRSDHGWGPAGARSSGPMGRFLTEGKEEGNTLHIV